MTHPMTGKQRVEFLERLAQTGLDDVHTLQRETAEQVLTEKRMRLLESIDEHSPSSVRELARQVERNVSIVSRDLDVLFEAEVIDFEKEGRSKRPVLAHENIFVDPVVFRGSVIGDTDHSDTAVVVSE